MTFILFCFWQIVSEEQVKKSLAGMGKSLKQLETDVKNAQKEKNVMPNDRFAEVMGDFYNQAKEQHEVLEGMSIKMSTLFVDMGKYFAFDPKKYTMDEFFGDIKKFIEDFKVKLWEIYLKESISS